MFKKMKIAIWTLILLCWLLTPFTPAHAENQRGKKPKIWQQADQIWSGQYTDQDLAKWRKRLTKLRSSGKWARVALCYNVLGVILYHQGEMNDSLEYLNQSLELSREKGFDKLEMIGLYWLSIAQKRKGLREDALKSLKESLRLAREGGYKRRESKCLRRIGLLMMGYGRYRESMDYLQKSLEVARQKQDNQLMMLSLNGIGLVHRDLGNTEKAKAFLTRSLKMSQESGNRKWEALNLNGLGDICLGQKDYRCAFKRYRESVDLLESSGAKGALAKTYHKMGHTYLLEKKPETALHYFKKSYATAASIGIRGRMAKISRDMGKAYGRMGQAKEALEKVDEAIAFLAEAGIADALRASYYTKGVLLERMGERDRAEKNYKRSIEILEGLRSDVAHTEADVESFVERRGQAYNRLISLLSKEGRVAEALQYLERSRLKKLRDQFDQLKPQLINEAEEEAKGKEKALREKIEGARIQLTDEKSKPKAKQNRERIARLEKDLMRERQEYLEYVNNLREQFPNLASLLAIQPDTLIDLQNLLPSHVCIVQYLILEEGTHIFMVTNQLVFHKEVKVNQRILEGKIDAFRGLLEKQRGSRSRGLKQVKVPEGKASAASRDGVMKSLHETAEELYGLLMGPLEKELSGFKILGVIPNGKLHLLPFQALGKRSPSGRFRFLVEDRSIFRLNSQSILKFAQKQAKQVKDGGRLIAFGNPNHSLKYAEKEIEMIKETFSKSTTFVREEASEDKVKRRLAGHDVLHLATHAKMGNTIRETYVLLARSHDGREDGKLFLREIWGLPLRGYQLVTLSACETAIGKQASGDIIVSLETAFLRAGAPTIVASLWEVDDEATGILMKRFYHNLVTKEKAEALREAQTVLMKDPRYASPYFWAPFILVGDWR